MSVAAIDAFRGYATALGAELPAATLVMAAFHAIALANRAVDQVRRRVQNETLGHRGRRADPLFRIRRVSLVAVSRLNERGWARLLGGLEAGDPSRHLSAAWIAKEELRRVYTTKTPEAARRALTRFYAHCADTTCPSLCASPAPSVPGRTRSSPTTAPAAPPLQRTHRGGQPPHREDPPHRSRVPQLRQLPAAIAPRLRRPLAECARRTTPRAPPRSVA